MSIVAPPINCNYFEIYLGQPSSKAFDCTITQQQFNLWKQKCSMYKSKELVITKLHYKQLVMESLYKPIYFHQQLLSHNVCNQKLIHYYTNSPIKNSEFPCKKKYTHEEHSTSTMFLIDKNINVLFTSTPTLNVKITGNNSNDLNLTKLHRILHLFT